MKNSLTARSIYGIQVNNGPWSYATNIVPSAGILDLLDVYIGNGTQTTTWYLAPFAGNVTPAAGWTATTFDSLATEFTNYTQSTRPALVPGAAASGEINNLASLATITVGADTATQDTIWGIGLISSSTKEGTTGVLFSAARLATSRANLLEDDQINLSYRLQISNA